MPEHVYRKLRDRFDQAYANWDRVREEEIVDVIYTPLPSKFVDIGPLAFEVMDDLKPLHEAWSGMELEGTSSYGIRAYQNGSSLVMHYDRVSFISGYSLEIGHIW